MTQLILGLILFLGAHSVRIWADGWRNQTIETYGEKTFKGVHALVSLLGFYLLIVGYGEARLETVAPGLSWRWRFFEKQPIRAQAVVADQLESVQR